MYIFLSVFAQSASLADNISGNGIIQTSNTIKRNEFELSIKRGNQYNISEYFK